jgi:3-dehydroquinate synthase/shikimate kinase/3-dehydroquinate synthase
VWLVGMPGSGKSATGRALAERLGLAFVDLDDEVERTTGRSVEEVFGSDGEAAFRELEARTLASVAGGPAAVVATGGGAVMVEANRRLMRRTGRVWHLTVDAATARQRLAADPRARPLLSGEDAWERLARDRDPLYSEVSDVALAPRSTDGPEAVAASIAGDLEPVTTVPVHAAGGGYDVVVGAGLHGQLRFLVPEGEGPGTAFVIADRPVADRFLGIVSEGLFEAGWMFIHLPIPSGEAAKSLAVAEAIYRQLAVHEAQRADLVVALGGGCTSDLAGFVAATYLRGMQVVQLPTTLLAQVDAAIGGKAAVNLPEGKNLVGAFHQPVITIADVLALSTLPEPEYRSGLGEVAKYALAFDRGILDLLARDTGWLRSPPNPRRHGTSEVHDLVRRCVEIKAEIVSKDERDAGERLFLNYGHTLGHALERLDGFHGRSHGEAVAIGMVFAARLADRLGLARDDGLVERHVRLLGPLGLPTGGPLPPSGDILAAMRMDKKRRGGLRFVLLEDVGRPTIATDVPDDVVVDTLEAM